MVNKANMIERTAQLINEKKIEGITDIRDESDRDGMRIVYELRKDAIPNIVLNNLYKQTQLQSSFSVNNVALVGGRPKTLNLKELILHYVDHRHVVVVKRTEFELEEAQKRAHILLGYLIALDNLDEVIALIRNSRDPEVARNGLIERFALSEIQARAILDMRLQRLTGLEREKIQKEYDDILLLIEDLNNILADEGRRMQIIKDELIEIKDRYGDERRTDIEHAADEFTAEDMIPDDEMVITISHEGYIKRTPLIEYRTQGRGGVGSRAVSTKNSDFTEHLFVATMHNYLLIFTEFGKVFWHKVWAIPEGSKTSKGRAIQNLINIEVEDKVRSVINVKTLDDPDYINNNFLIMCTLKGTIKKTSLEAYSRPRQNGINAITINEDDKLLSVQLTTGDSHIVIASNSGRAIHFSETDVRSMGRTATGVRGINLSKGGFVVGMVCVDHKEPPQLLVVSEKGYGKRSDLEDYRITKRGGKGVKTINITEKTGNLVAIKAVTDTDDLMIINKSGIAIRMAVSGLRVMGRATQGVRLIRLNEKDQISAVENISRILGVIEDEDLAAEEGLATEEGEPNEDGGSAEEGDKNKPTDSDETSTTE
jgi:DNA gyrase subunit A